jgi:hypothetical protein
MGKFYSVINLEPGILFNSDEIGVSVPIAIGGQKGELYLPQLPGNFADFNFDEDWFGPPLDAPSEFHGYRESEKSLFWGRNIGKHQSEIHRIGFIFSFDGPDKNYEIGDVIYKDLGRWLRDFFCFVEYVTGKGQVCASIKRNLSFSDLFLFYRGQNGKLEYAYDTSNKLTTSTICIDDDYKKDKRINYEKLRDICGYCSEKKKFKLEHEIMLEARRAFHSEDFRKAVLDSATAAELVLTNRAKDEMVNFGGKERDRIFRRFKMLAGSFELLNVLRVSLPVSYERFKTGLNDPRNKVIHGGFSPDRKMAYDALKIAETFLKEFSTSIVE